MPIFGGMGQGAATAIEKRSNGEFSVDFGMEYQYNDSWL